MFSEFHSTANNMRPLHWCRPSPVGIRRTTTIPRLSLYILFLHITSSSTAGHQQTSYFPSFIQTCTASQIPSNMETEKHLTLEYNFYQQALSQCTSKDGSQHIYGNLVYSPYSIDLAFGMLYLGANGETYKQLNDMYFKNRNSSEVAAMLVPPNWGQLFESSKLSDEEKGGDTCGDKATEAVMPPSSIGGKTVAPNVVFGRSNIPKEVKLAIANALALDASIKDNETTKRYQELLEKLYKSETQFKDFKFNSATAVKEINKWVEDVTRNKITNLLSPGDVSRDTISILVSAIYFKGSWTFPFKPVGMKTELRFEGVGSEGEVEMQQVQFMTLKSSFRGVVVQRVENNGVPVMVVSLPYVGAKGVSFNVFMPENMMAFEAFTKKWRSDASIFDGYLKKAVNSPPIGEKEIFMPKFKIEASDISFDLKKILADLGLSKLFDGSDFSNIYGPPGYVAVGSAVHKAMIDVNEDGTEAAAATAVGLMMTSVPRPPSITARIDKPFFFQMRLQINKNDIKNDFVLFMGQVSDVKKLQ